MPTKDEIAPTRLRALSDAELLQRDFDTTDPELLPGITWHPPVDVTPNIEFAYSLKTRGRKVRCVYCKFDNHFTGVVVSYPTGERALVGRDCATQHHGADFGVLLTDFDAAKLRQDYLRRKAAVLAARHELQSVMRSLLAEPSVETYGELRKEWRDLMGSMFSSLTDVARSDGVLRADRLVRDTVAEQRRAEKFAGMSMHERRAARRRGDFDPITSRVMEDLGRLRGPGFFFPDDSVATKLKEVEADLNRSLRTLSTDDLSVKTMREELVALVDCRRRILEQLGRLEELPAVFDPVNLGRIVVWANDRAETEKPREAPIPHHSPTLRQAPPSRPLYSFGRFHASERAFHRTADSGRTWTVQLPAAFAVPKPAVLEILSRALAPS